MFITPSLKVEIALDEYIYYGEKKRFSKMDNSKHPVSYLQELMIKSHKPLPLYNMVQSDAGFICTLSVDNITTSATASSKHAAKLEAATEAIALIKEQDSLPNGTGFLNSINNVADSVLPNADSPLSSIKTENSSSQDVPSVTIAKHPVSELQELMMKQRKLAPVYNTTNISRSTYPYFRCTLFVDGLTFVSEAVSKQIARKKAADAALKQFKHFSLQVKLEVTTDTLFNPVKVDNDSSFQDSPSVTIGKHPITELQELMVKQRKPAPIYNSVDISTSKNPYFRCTLHIEDLTFVSEATSKHIARKQAADIALKQLRGHSQNTDITSTSQAENLLDYNAVGTLNEYLQKKNAALACFLEMSTNIKGEFVMSCNAAGETTQGYGVTKKLARKDAAHKMVELLNIKNPQPTLPPIIEPKMLVDDKEAIEKFTEMSKINITFIEAERTYQLQPLDGSTKEITETKLE